MCIATLSNEIFHSSGWTCCIFHPSRLFRSSFAALCGPLEAALTALFLTALQLTCLRTVLRVIAEVSLCLSRQPPHCFRKQSVLSAALSRDLQQENQSGVNPAATVSRCRHCFVVSKHVMSTSEEPFLSLFFFFLLLHGSPRLTTFALQKIIKFKIIEQVYLQQSRVAISLKRCERFLWVPNLIR